MTYWAIGRDILERQDEDGWGAKVIDRLSADLQQRCTIALAAPSDPAGQEDLAVRVRLLTPPAAGLQ